MKILDESDIAIAVIFNEMLLSITTNAVDFSHNNANLSKKGRC